MKKFYCFFVLTALLAISLPLAEDSYLKLVQTDDWSYIIKVNKVGEATLKADMEFVLTSNDIAVVLEAKYIDSTIGWATAVWAYENPDSVFHLPVGGHEYELSGWLMPYFEQVQTVKNIKFDSETREVKVWTDIISDSKENILNLGNILTFFFYLSFLLILISAVLLTIPSNNREDVEFAPLVLTVALVLAPLSAFVAALIASPKPGAAVLPTIVALVGALVTARRGEVTEELKKLAVAIMIMSLSLTLISWVVLTSSWPLLGKMILVTGATFVLAKILTKAALNVEVTNV